MCYISAPISHLAETSLRLGRVTAPYDTYLCWPLVSLIVLECLNLIWSFLNILDFVKLRHVPKTSLVLSEILIKNLQKCKITNITKMVKNYQKLGYKFVVLVSFSGIPHGHHDSYHCFGIF